MGGSRRMNRLFWRLRSNALRRRDDIVEAWIVLIMWVVVVAGGTLVGLLTAHAADDMFARRRAERHSTHAVLLADTPDSASGTGGVSGRVSAEVRWTTADNSIHTGRTLVEGGQKAGAQVVVWLDDQGKLTAEPPSPTEAAVESGILGAAASLALTGIAFGAGAASRWRLERRRLDQWGREWDVVGPRWGYKTG
ncbi:hypothetical protein ABT173_42755 [Streptomyces sp. NPDC001795]|uniref:Rv1733c family protein n=1 Tax=unclassified Streptomyces TaxID=2593676 RepID=UPI00333282B5